MIIHGLSMTIGATVAVAVMLVAFVIFLDTEKPLNPIEVQPAKITASTLVENGSPRLGDVNAPVTVVEFGDYQCFFCNKFYHDTEKKLIEDFVDTGIVSWIFKDFTIIGPDSVAAALSEQDVQQHQNMFWECRSMTYYMTPNWSGENNGWASAEHLEEFAAESLFHMTDKKSQLEKHDWFKPSSEWSK